MPALRVLVRPDLANSFWDHNGTPIGPCVGPSAAWRLCAKHAESATPADSRSRSASVCPDLKVQGGHTHRRVRDRTGMISPRDHWQKSCPRNLTVDCQISAG